MKFFSLIIVLITSTIAYSENTPVATVSFELKEDHRIYIKLKVNETDSLSFLFDTGANAMVINSQVLGKKLNLKLNRSQNNNGVNGSHQVRVSDNNTIEFSGIKHNNISFLSIDYGVGNRNNFDGVFGSNIMRDYIIEIDYAKKEMRFFNPKTYVYKTKGFDKYALGTALGGSLYKIKASINIDDKKYTGNFELDTWSDGGLKIFSPFVIKHKFNKLFKSVAETRYSGSSGSSVISPIVILPEIQLNKKYFYRFPATLLANTTGVFASKEMAGLFGNNFLKRFQTILDIPNWQIFLKPNDLLHMPYYGFLIK